MIYDTPHFYKTLQEEQPEPLQALYQRISRILHDVWTSVHDVLCNDAPEGYVPEDMEDANFVSTKDILSFCWRALREAR